MNPNFEKYIRKTLRDQEEQVNAEAIWQQVEAHVRPEKRRRKYFWWFFFGAATGLITLGLLWSAKQTESLSPSLANSAVIEQTDKAEVNTSTSTGEEMKTAKNSLNNNTKTQSNTIGLNEANLSAEIVNEIKNSENINQEEAIKENRTKTYLKQKASST